MKKHNLTKSQKETTRNAILDSRELRSLILDDQINTNNLVVTMSLNIPGYIKATKETSEFLKKFYFNFLGELGSKYNVLNTFCLEDFAGEIYFMILEYSDAYKIKKLCLAYEEKYGTQTKLLDIDVYETLTHKISRTDVGPHSPRQCFLCNNEAKVCANRQTHSIEELDAFIDEQISKPIPFKLSFAYIYDDLASKMHSGVFQSGEKLLEDNLAKEYGVSRTLIRTVITELNSLGMVEVRKNVGATVVTLNKKSILEASQTRMAIEQMIYRNIYEHLTDSKRTILRRLKEIMLKVDLDNTDDMLRINKLFNTIMRSLSNNEFMKGIFKRVNDVFNLTNPKRYQKGNLRKESFSEHIELIDSLLNDDVEEMEVLLNRHLLNAQENAVKAYE
ncbi:apo-citrate lyase phosphoribosyl-dephospho-CoA transferase [Mesoplasma lactucae ATCC 49193]|nr:citrate lyase holo-[acyl-carrier protein] synthase [Mesoplasma lactucae]ATZ20475.1 hypothetical protein MLACT_v1c06540 [Mesoplasma lactucae ATCC 49193]MCL8216647.1 apo-citrate lyase phosphoribosyl-dephospho-CoA transferase [Mesoplasma lactucae ATCC 49193]